jgi:hypothetical protein
MNSNDAPVTKQNVIIERIARKSLVCLASTFIVNIIMNILKITSFLGDRSDLIFFFLLLQLFSKKKKKKKQKKNPLIVCLFTNIIIPN